MYSVAPPGGGNKIQTPAFYAFSSALSLFFVADVETYGITNFFQEYFIEPNAQQHKIYNVNLNVLYYCRDTFIHS